LKSVRRLAFPVGVWFGLLCLAGHGRLQAAEQPSAPSTEAMPPPRVDLHSWRAVELTASNPAWEFEVMAPQDGTLLPQIATEAYPLAWECLDPLDESVRATGNRLPVQAGRNRLRLRARMPDPEPDEPATVRFRLHWTPSEIETPNPTGEVHLRPGIIARFESSRIVEDPLRLIAKGIRSGAVVWFHAIDERGKALPLTLAGQESMAPAWIRSHGPPPSVTLAWPEPRPRSVASWIRVEPSLDPREPNDALHQSSPLRIDRPVLLRLYPAGDRDWFALSLETSGSWRAVLLSEAGTLFQLEHGIEARITDPEGRPLAQRSAPVTDPFAWRSPSFELAAGSYRIWLRGRRGSRSRERFQFVVEPAESSEPSRTDFPVALEYHPVNPPPGDDPFPASLETVASTVIAPTTAAGTTKGSPPLRVNAASEEPDVASGTFAGDERGVETEEGLPWWFGVVVFAILAAVLLLPLLAGRRARGMSDLTG